MRRLVLFGCLAALVLPAGGVAAQPSQAAARQPTLEVDLEPSELRIGDRLQAVLTFAAPSPIAEAPRFPAWEERWGDAEVLTVEPPREVRDGVWVQRLELAIFDTGIATLPAVEVLLPGPEETLSARSEPAVVEVRSVLPPDAEEAAPQPPEPARELPVGRRFWWTAAALGLACAVLALLLLRAARRVRDAVDALTLSPIESLRSALARLRREDRAERLVAGLSLELRRYLGRALGFPAAEGTTTEIQRSLRRRQLPDDIVRDTLDLLREADRVKFARGEVAAGDADRRIDEVGRIADRVESWLEPPEEDAAASEAAA